MRKVSIFLLAVMCAGVVFGQSKQKVAVYVTGDADAGHKKVIGAKMVTAITKDDGYAAVERTADFLNELDKEHIYQRTGAVDDEQIAKLGKQFGVNFVCVADVSKVFESVFISARLINVETALIVATADRDKEIKGMSDLVEISENVANGLINATTVCNKKDKPLNSKGCCKGMVAIDGICRDVSGDMYWIDWESMGLPPVKYEKKGDARGSGGLGYADAPQSPRGYRLPTKVEAEILYKIFKQPLWTSEYSVDEGKNNRGSQLQYDSDYCTYRYYDYKTTIKTYYIWNGTNLSIGYRNPGAIEKGIKYGYQGSKKCEKKENGVYDTYKEEKISEISNPALAVFLRE